MGPVEPHQNQGLDCIRGPADLDLDGLPRAGWEVAEQKVGGILPARRTANADAYAVEVAGAEGCADRPQPVVAVVATTELHPQLAGLDVELIELFHVYSDPSRDPRKHTVSTVFIGRAHGEPQGGDDAARCIVCTPDELPGKLVFDHALIVSDYVAYKRTGKRPPPKR